MDRINGAGTIDIGGGRRGFRSENLPTGTEGTEVTDEWLNAVQENILKVIEEAGLALDVDNWSLLWQAIRFTQMADGYFSVTDRRNDPPGAPAVGDRYIVGGVPTGAWAGQEDKIALWLGAWAFIPPKPWMHVGFADRTDWRWDHTTDEWVPWAATEAETLAGADTRKFITPAMLAASRMKSKVPHVSCLTSEGGGVGTVIPGGGVWTLLSNHAQINAFLPGGSTFVGGVLTISAADAGIWLMTLALYENNLGTTGQATRILINGVQVCGDGAQTTGNGALGLSASSTALPLEEGDVVRFEVIQSTAGALTFDSYSISAVRLSAAE